MSDYQAIGGVSESLKALLRDRMEVPGKFKITVSPPPTLPENGDSGATEELRVNLFLYRVTRNGALANQEIPGDGHPTAYGSPPLSLDLHYLLTAYGTSEQGDEVDETVSHFLLGSAMRVMHDVPILTGDVIGGDGQPVLHPSLLGEYEQVKISLDSISLEDLAKVWTATTFPYRLSAAYTVSVVRIESTNPRRHPQPVGEPVGTAPIPGPKITVLPHVRPFLAEVRVRRAGNESRFPYGRIGDELVLLGSGLTGGEARVWLGSVEATAGIDESMGDRMVVIVPDHPDLQPGSQTVSVTIGGPAFRSNLAVFVLVPRVDGVVDGSGPERRLKIAGSRLWADDLSGEALVGDEGVTKSEYVTAAEDEVTIPVPDTLPAWPVKCLRSESLAAQIPPPPVEFQAEIGGMTQNLELARTLDDPSALAPVLQQSLRTAGSAGRRFAGARVAWGAGRFWVVAGELVHEVELSGDAAEAMMLAPPDGVSVQGYLSGRLSPFPRITATTPEMSVEIDGESQDVALAIRPSSLDEAAVLLRDAIRATGVAPGFTDAEVVVMGDQLLIIPGGVGANVVFSPVVDDATSVVELRLALDLRVRVRVNGAESVDPFTLSLP